jgi:tagaturonate reductase
MHMSKILAFGTGVLLRGLVADLAERAGMTLVMVSQTPSGDERARLLNENGGRFTLRTRGLSATGSPIDTEQTVGSITRVLPAATGWQEALALAADPTVTLVTSNVSESGFRPDSPFPGRLAEWLHARYQAGLPGVDILPCELIEGNGGKLREMVRAASAEPAFLEWLDAECAFCDTLVDRICTQDDGEPLAAIVEPYCFWAVAGKDTGALGALAAASDGALLLTDDLPRYMLRKLRLLNGLHTAMASIGPKEYGVETVREALEHQELGPFLEAMLYEELLPTVCPPLDKTDAMDYAQVTLSRMRNPFLVHKLSAIAVGAPAKWESRLLPAMATYEERFGQPPPRLTRCRAAFLRED